MLSNDLNLMDHHGMTNSHNGYTNGLVTDDILFGKNFNGPHTGTVCAMPQKRNNYRQPKMPCQNPPGASSFLSPTFPADSVVGVGVGVGQHLPQTFEVPQTDAPPMVPMSSLSEKELERRQKLRERKRVQRQNQDFAERERLRARGRIKALREDPVFRQTERKRDRERRRKARLMNQAQRIQERDRDKVRKSMMRSLIQENKAESLSRNNDNSSKGQNNHNVGHMNS